METETYAMQVLRPGCFIGEELAVEGSLGKILARDRHRAPVSFKKEICPPACAACIGKFQGEHAIRDDAKFQVVVYVHPPPKRLVLAGKHKFSLGNETNSALTASKFNRHHHIRD